MSADVFGQSPEGDPVRIFTISNAAGMTARFIDYGAALVSLTAPDCAGRFADIVLGFDAPEHYAADPFFIGAVIGRCANRIDRARFHLDGRTHQLTRSDGDHHLHGGFAGFHKVIWDAELCTGAGRSGVRFRRLSPDGEEGYPGNLQVHVTYWLTDTNELLVHYDAGTDAATPVNLTQHSYFNLAGHDAGSALGHRLLIHADRFTPVGESLIPTGELRPVDGTPMDFRHLTEIGARIDEDFEQLAFGRGYDHNWVIHGEPGQLRPAARLEEPRSGRCVEVHTTQPGLQFYSDNFLDGSSPGKGGARYAHRQGLCLEAQHFPDSPNQASFLSAILRPEDRYTHQTQYRFGVC